jgi:uncharacterized membrane protein HdeD (DUF308 family)
MISRTIPIGAKRKKFAGVHQMVSGTESLNRIDFAREVGVLRRHRVGIFWLGVALIVLGCAALAASAFTTLMSVLVLGVLLVLGGLGQAIHAFWVRRWDGFFAYLITGNLSLVVGLLFLTWPTLAELAMTMFVAMLFIVIGLFRLNVAMLWRFPAWGWVVADSILSILLGLLICVAWPECAVWIIGMLIGIDLFFKGWSCLMFALAGWPA